MVTVDATTPQLKAVKGLVEALVSDNFKTIESFLSKDYVFKTFPITPELPDLTRNEYLQKYGAVIPLFAKAGVRIGRFSNLLRVSRLISRPIGCFS